jgi:hypothetical protein
VTGQTAFRFVTSSERTIIAQSITVTSGTVYTFSFYIEQLTTTTAARQIFNFHSGATSQVWRDPDGLILDSANNLPNKLGKYTITATANDTTIVLRFGAGVQSNTDADLVVVAPQLEVGSVATSYIPTVAATATRNADVITKTGVSGFIGQAEGTVYAEVDLRSIATVRTVMALSDGTGTTSNRIAVNLSTNQVSIACNFASGSTVVLNSALILSGLNKIAVAYTGTTIDLIINGGSPISTTTGGFGNYSKIHLGINQANTSQLNDSIRAAAIYPTRLSNTELAALTTL